MTKKSGFRNGKQKYKYQNCDQQFLGGVRIENDLLWEDYLRGKQTYLQLAKKYNCSKRTIQRKIDLHQVHETLKQVREVLILMDTTY